MEDNPVNQRVMGHILKRLGHSFDVVANGAEAIENARNLPYDLVLMDCQMPETDGYQATAAIRGLGGPAGRIPIIAMTANAMSRDREACLAAGMDDYLSKPVTPAEVARMLDGWSAKRREPVLA